MSDDVQTLICIVLICFSLGFCSTQMNPTGRLQLACIQGRGDWDHKTGNCVFPKP